MIKHASQLQNTKTNIELAKEKKLDYKKLHTPTIPAEDVKRYAEEMLASLGVLSIYQGSREDLARFGSAPDDKWQVIITSEAKLIAHL